MGVVKQVVVQAVVADADLVVRPHVAEIVTEVVVQDAKADALIAVLEIAMDVVVVVQAVVKAGVLGDVTDAKDASDVLLHVDQVQAQIVVLVVQISVMEDVQDRA
jgi:hypothetical protein